jgi:hypothetical protein
VTGYVTHVEHISDVYKISFRKPERNRSLGISEHRYDSNIIMKFRGTELKSGGWMHLHQDWDQCRVLANLVMNLGLP